MPIDQKKLGLLFRLNIFRMLNIVVSSQVPESSSSSPSSSLPTTKGLFSPSSGDIPNDLLIEILKRLPLKALIRLTCVCKYWLSLLGSPIFISAHTSHHLNRADYDYPNCHVFKEPINVYTRSIFTNFSVYNTDTLFKRFDFECPVGQNHFVVCCRDGLFCLFDFYSCDPGTSPLILWNPSIRKATVIPVPFEGDADVELTAGGFPKLLFGFGFDSISSDYKLVRVAYFNGGDSGVGTCFRADVYGMSVGDWRSLGRVRLSRNFSTIRWRGVYLNEVIHWVCNGLVSCNDGSSSGSSGRSILTFKLGSGEFGEMKLPKELADGSHETVRVVTVPRSSKEVLGVVHNVGSVLSVWAMGEYSMEESWVKLFMVDFGSMVVKHDMNVALLDEETAMVQMSSGMWIFYDDKLKERRDLMKALEGLDYVGTYVESLILLGHQSRYGLEVLPYKRIQQGRRKRKCSSTFRNG